MSNPPKAKGTNGENEILELLREHRITANRTEAGRESHDIRVEGLVVEVKFRKAWALHAWIRKIRKVADDNRWAIFAIHGDRRTKEGAAVGRVAVFDADFAAELLECWNDEQEWLAEASDVAQAVQDSLAEPARFIVETGKFVGEQP